MPRPHLGCQRRLLRPLRRLWGRGRRRLWLLLLEPPAATTIAAAAQGREGRGGGAAHAPAAPAAGAIAAGALVVESHRLVALLVLHDRLDHVRRGVEEAAQPRGQRRPAWVTWRDMTTCQHTIFQSSIPLRTMCIDTPTPTHPHTPFSSSPTT